MAHLVPPRDEAAQHTMTARTIPENAAFIPGVAAAHEGGASPTANQCHLAAPSPDPFYTPSPEDMYTEDELAEDPSGKISRRGTGPSMKASVPDFEGENYHQKENYYQDRIQSLEEEVIKLLLQNSFIPGVGPALVPEPSRIRIQAYGYPKSKAQEECVKAVEPKQETRCIYRPDDLSHRREER
ncbi:hypothetical protein HYPSUDRAFT_210278 [Hypholoma sublateritium FD-334 SS-4]|uniref:Uncharacterized protein n=1 Tax=Hypholoma sublateritium (strain FD-334 SS-4) TaxID=945553 RepID=A0A0D2N788_HYPSF|nr:hypothetical protein HYPSUDRAFT_210278 [Hypholoma sublateritium FD-334 SS-4]